MKSFRHWRIVLFCFSSLLALDARSEGTVHICPGSGIRCDVKTDCGEQLRSEKSKDEGSIIVIIK
ncbi:hypothetical protein [Roseivirga sp.]|uniref:hypothetical protein n=1 Tax=Roseivirga sp. TaxID=1964215 RepID=UPI003B52E3F6